MSKKHVFFIADDDHEDQELFISALRQVDEDCECVTAFNGEDAIKQLSEFKGPLPGIIFLDLNMPKLNGKECLGLIKKEATLRHIPVVMYSTSADQKEIDETKTLGAALFLQKPNRFDELCSALEKIIGHNWQPAH